MRREGPRQRHMVIWIVRDPANVIWNVVDPASVVCAARAFAIAVWIVVDPASVASV